MFDDPLVRYIENPSKRTFTLLFREHRTLALTIAHRVTRDWQAAEDVVQDVFTRLLLRPPATPLPVSPRTYLISLVHQRASERVRMEVSRKRREEAVVCRHRVARREQTYEELREAVDGLDEGIRWAIDLFYYYGLSQEEVSYILDCSTSTVSRRLELGKRILKKKLGAGGLVALGSWYRIGGRPIPSERLDRWLKETVEKTFPATFSAGLLTLLLKIAAGVLVVLVPGLLIVNMLVSRGNDEGRDEALAPRPVAPNGGSKRGQADAVGAIGADLLAPGTEAAREEQVTIVAQILEWDSSTPAAGVAVWAGEEKSEPCARSAVDGRFSATLPKERSRLLMLQKDGYLPTRVLFRGTIPEKCALYIVPEFIFLVSLVEVDEVDEADEE